MAICIIRLVSSMILPRLRSSKPAPPRPWFQDGVFAYAVSITPDGQIIMWRRDLDKYWRALRVAPAP